VKPKDDGTTVRGLDPSEFENAFVIEDESEEPSRVGTPSIGEENSATMAGSNATEAGEGSEKGAEKVADTTPQPPAELPAEVRVKLRKLEKLEAKYQGNTRGVGVLSGSDVS